MSCSVLHLWGLLSEMLTSCCPLAVGFCLTLFLPSLALWPSSVHVWKMLLACFLCLLRAESREPRCAKWDLSTAFSPPCCWVKLLAYRIFSLVLLVGTFFWGGGWGKVIIEGLTLSQEERWTDFSPKVSSLLTACRIGISLVVVMCIFLSIRAEKQERDEMESMTGETARG